MNKIIGTVLGLSLLSSPVFASKARLQALGEDINGSMFLHDSRNVFVNAAELNYHKDFITIEWGQTNNADATTSTADVDSTTDSRAEGGFFKSFGNMVYGVYLGAESEKSNMLRAASGVVDSTGKPLGEENTIDFFLAGDAGVEWGANVTYSNSMDDQDSTKPEQNVLRTRLGFISGEFEIFANIGLDYNASTEAAEYKEKSSYDIGATYALNDSTYMLRLTSLQGENRAGEEYKERRLAIGTAKTYTLNDKATMWISGWYKLDTLECDGAFATANTCNEGSTDKNDESYLPISIAFEVATTEWLTLRTSIGQNIIGTSDNGTDEKTITDSTMVNAGASLIFTDFQVDSVIGNDVNAEGDEKSVARISMTYKY